MIHFDNWECAGCKIGSKRLNTFIVAKPTNRYHDSVCQNAGKALTYEGFLRKMDKENGGRE